MFKTLGYDDIIRDGIAAANHIELLSKRDYRTAWDFNRPIANVYRELETTYQFVDAFGKSRLNGDGVFPSSLTHEFNIAVSDVARVNLMNRALSSSQNKDYARLKPGIASVSGNIVVHKPDVRYFERQVAELLGIFYHNEIEGVWVKYNATTHTYKSKIVKEIATVPTTYYHGCTGVSEWNDNGVTGVTAQVLITAMYNETDLNSYFVAELAGSIENLKLETLALMTTNGTKYWNIQSGEVVLSDTNI
jgi:hypothetical protein